MTVRLEHANLCVRNIDEMIRFLQTAFPEFRIRHDATGADGTRWVHVGTDETYLALNQAAAEPDAALPEGLNIKLTSFEGSKGLSAQHVFDRWHARR